MSANQSSVSIIGALNLTADRHDYVVRRRPRVNSVFATQATLARRYPCARTCRSWYGAGELHAHRRVTGWLPRCRNLVEAVADRRDPLKNRSHPFSPRTRTQHGMPDAAVDAGCQIVTRTTPLTLVPLSARGWRRSGDGDEATGTLRPLAPCGDVQMSDTSSTLGGCRSSST